MKKNYMEKEWEQLQRQEQAFLKRGRKPPASAWQDKIARLVPDKLSDTLNTAFYKAFEFLFEKGTGVIEKTCAKEKKEQNYKINAYAATVRKNRKTLRAFGREAKASKTLNMALSTAEGIGMGLLGLGIPDIPLFLGVLLKSVYEIAISYGFDYDSEEEQIFILKLMETALAHESALVDENLQLNRFIERREAAAEETDCGFEITREEQMRRTADALSNELLYLKFVQGLPVVGVLGGISDMVYQKKISDYAALKYKRRFLERNR